MISDELLLKLFLTILQVFRIIIPTLIVYVAAVLALLRFGGPRFRARMGDLYIPAMMALLRLCLVLATLLSLLLLMGAPRGSVSPLMAITLCVLGFAGFLHMTDYHFINPPKGFKKNPLYKDWPWWFGMAFMVFLIGLLGAPEGMLEGVVVLGVPEFVLILAAAVILAFSVRQAMRPFGDKKTQEGIEMVAGRMSEPAFIVENGRVVHMNASAAQNEMSETLREFALEVAGRMKAGGQVSKTVDTGNREFAVRGVQLAKSSVLVYFQGAAPGHLYYGNILKNMSHEISAPLDIVIGMASKMLLDANDVEGIGRSIEVQGIDKYAGGLAHETETIVRRGKAAKQLISRVLMLAKLQDPAFTELLDRESLSMLNLVDACVDAVETKHGISIPQHVSHNLPRINGNVGLLQRAVDNLLENAVKYSADNIQIVVKLNDSEIDGFVTCQVIDKGIGMSANHHGDIFREGVQLDESMPGLGLGLAEVKRTVELHGGQIAVRSTEGQGSAFTVHLPCADD